MAPVKSIRGSPAGSLTQPSRGRQMVPRPSDSDQGGSAHSGSNIFIPEPPPLPKFLPPAPFNLNPFPPYPVKISNAPVYQELLRIRQSTEFPLPNFPYLRLHVPINTAPKPSHFRKKMAHDIPPFDLQCFKLSKKSISLTKSTFSFYPNQLKPLPSLMSLKLALPKFDRPNSVPVPLFHASKSNPFYPRIAAPSQKQHLPITFKPQDPFPPSKQSVNKSLLPQTKQKCAKKEGRRELQCSKCGRRFYTLPPKEKHEEKCMVNLTG